MNRMEKPTLEQVEAQTVTEINSLEARAKQLREDALRLDGFRLCLKQFEETPDEETLSV